jgi:hypothetical protein
MEMADMHRDVENGEEHKSADEQDTADEIAGAEEEFENF